MAKFIISAFADEINSSLKTQMDVLDKHGVHYVELRSINGKNITEHTLAEAREVRREMDARGFSVSAIGSPIGKIKITDDFMSHLELFRHTLELAYALGTQYVRMFSFFMPEGDDPSVWREEVLARWGRFVQAAKGSGLILLHENEGDVYAGNASRSLDLVRSLDCPYVKLVFDPGNFVLAYPDDCYEAYLVLKPYVIYLHAKDGLRSKGIFVPSGQGDGRMTDILADLGGQDGELFVSIEPHLAGHFEGSGPELFSIAHGSLVRLLHEGEK